MRVYLCIHTVHACLCPHARRFLMPLRRDAISCAIGAARCQQDLKTLGSLFALMVRDQKSALVQVRAPTVPPEHPHSTPRGPLCTPPVPFESRLRLFGRVSAHRMACPRLRAAVVLKCDSAAQRGRRLEHEIRWSRVRVCSCVRVCACRRLARPPSFSCGMCAPVRVVGVCARCARVRLPAYVCVCFVRRLAAAADAALVRQGVRALVRRPPSRRAARSLLGDAAVGHGPSPCVSTHDVGLGPAPA